MSEVGAAACDDVLASKATEESGVADALRSANSNTRSSGSNIYRGVPTPHYSASTPQVWPKECSFS